jgi:hypothetical protein
MTHILVCGDSTIDKFYGDVQAQLLLTDPPYNVNYKGR